MITLNHKQINDILNRNPLPEGLEFYKSTITCEKCNEDIEIKLFDIIGTSGGIATYTICYLLKKGEDKSFIYVEPIEFFSMNEEYKEEIYKERLQFKINLFLERLKNGTAKKVYTNGGDLGRDEDKIWKI